MYSQYSLPVEDDSVDNFLRCHIIFRVDYTESSHFLRDGVGVAAIDIRGNFSLSVTHHVNIKMLH